MPEILGLPSYEEWSEAAWAIQGWVRSCFDVTGVCTLCGTGDSRAHVNDCPWPKMRQLLDRDLFHDVYTR